MVNLFPYPLEKRLSLTNSKTELKSIFSFKINCFLNSTPVHTFLETGCEKQTKDDYSKRCTVTMQNDMRRRSLFGWKLCVPSQVSDLLHLQLLEFRKQSTTFANER